MSLSKEQVIDKIEVVENGTLQVRQVTRIMEDGKELSSSYHRWSFAPGSDVSEMPANVQAIATAAWTEEVVSAFEAKVAASLAANTPSAE
jgi:hypothetical protein